MKGWPFIMINIVPEGQAVYSWARDEIDIAPEATQIKTMKPNTYTQLYVHCVFAVKYRAAVIENTWQDRLRKYITAIVQNNGHKLIAINSMPDHLHMFAGLSPKQAISEMMRLVKGDSSEFINKQRFTKRKFQWQEGYGAFSNSRSQIDAVVKYILNQQVHHRKRTFRDEYVKMLKDYNIDYDVKYLFHDLLEEG